MAVNKKVQSNIKRKSITNNSFRTVVAKAKIGTGKLIRK